MVVQCGTGLPRGHAGAAAGAAAGQRTRFLHSLGLSGRRLARRPWAPGAPALAAPPRGRCRHRPRPVRGCGPGRDRDSRPTAAAVRAIALGTLRWYLRLAPALELLLERPRESSRAVRALLAVAAHQVEYSRNAPEATVHAAVDAARLLGATAQPPASSMPCCAGSCASARRSSSASIRISRHGPPTRPGWSSASAPRGRTRRTAVLDGE